MKLKKVDNMNVSGFFVHDPRIFVRVTKDSFFESSRIWYIRIFHMFQLSIGFTMCTDDSGSFVILNAVVKVWGRPKKDL